MALADIYFQHREVLGEQPQYQYAERLWPGDLVLWHAVGMGREKQYWMLD